MAARARANQGYQLPLTPAKLYRAAIEGSDAYCRKTSDKASTSAQPEQKEAFLKDLAGRQDHARGRTAGPDASSPSSTRT